MQMRKRGRRGASFVAVLAAVGTVAVAVVAVVSPSSITQQCWLRRSPENQKKKLVDCLALHPRPDPNYSGHHPKKRRETYGELRLQGIRDVLHLLGQALDVGIPLAHLLADLFLGAAANLLARGFAALEPDEAVDLVDAVDEAAQLDHLGRGLLGLVAAQAQEHAEGVEADVAVEARDAQQVVLDDGLGQHGGAAGLPEFGILEKMFLD